MRLTLSKKYICFLYEKIESALLIEFASNQAEDLQSYFVTVRVCALGGNKRQDWASALEALVQSTLPGWKQTSNVMSRGPAPFQLFPGWCSCVKPGPVFLVAVINGIKAPYPLLKTLSAVSIESDYGLHANFYMSYSNIKYDSRIAQNYKEKALVTVLINIYLVPTMC